MGKNKDFDDEIEILSLTPEYKTLKNKDKSNDDFESDDLKKENEDREKLLSLTIEYNNLKSEFEKYKEEHTFEKTNNKKTDNKKKLINNFGVLCFKIVFILLIIYVMFFKIFGVTRMSSNGMHPTISKGSLVLFYRFDKEYHVGDVVTFKKNGKRYVLRIVALEKQTVFINDEDEISNSSSYVEKQMLFKDIIPEKSKIKYPYDVSSNKVFVVGDYRLETDDSRMFGAIDVSLIDGKVISLLQTKDI